MKVVYNLILFFLFVFFQLQSFAQGCSTCRAQIISSSKDDLTIGNGLNTGILFLMIVPYIILFFLFRKHIFNIYKSFKPN
jgi:ABC-type glycerol-3-phosphate transport system permease component